jgi:hypothetical protein
MTQEMKKKHAPCFLKFEHLLPADSWKLLAWLPFSRNLAFSTFGLLIMLLET